MSIFHPHGDAGGRIRNLIKAEFVLGDSASADPSNANLPDLSLRVTTLYSPWFGRSCRVCADRFREGDLVRLCPLCGSAYHDDRMFDLHCWQRHFNSGKACGSNSRGKICAYTFQGELPKDPDPETDRPNTAPNAILVPLTQIFLSGVQAVWKPYGDQSGEKVERGSPFLGRKCPWCRNQVRVGDWIIPCPCGSNCGTVFHQDIFRHLTCWNEWNGVEGNQYCPNTGVAYKPQPAKTTGSPGGGR